VQDKTLQHCFCLKLPNSPCYHAGCACFGTSAPCCLPFQCWCPDSTFPISVLGSTATNVLGGGVTPVQDARWAPPAHATTGRANHSLPARNLLLKASKAKQRRALHRRSCCQHTGRVCCKLEALISHAGNTSGAVTSCSSCCCCRCTQDPSTVTCAMTIAYLTAAFASLQQACSARPDPTRLRTPAHGHTGAPASDTKRTRGTGYILQQQ
jgi:hypothetical protein